MFSRVRLLDSRQMKMLIADLDAARSIEARRHFEVELQLAETMIAHLIHETIEKGL